MFAGLASAQITNVTDDTSTPIPGVGHDYFKMANETVNPSNGSVSIRIQVPMPKGRGLTLPFAFAYDTSGVWHMIAGDPGMAVWSGGDDYISKWGWSYTVPRLNMMETAYNVMRQGRLIPCYVYNDYVFSDAGGGRHSFRMDVDQAPFTECTTAYPSHVSGGDPQFKAATSAPDALPVTVTDNDGTFYQFTSYGTEYYGNDPNPQDSYYSALPAYVQDRNGNRLTITDSGNGAFNYQDTLGRTGLSSSGFGATGNTVSVSGISGSYSLTWQQFSLNLPVHGYTQIGSDAYCYPPGYGTGGGHNQSRVTRITLPNTTSYTFDYDSTFGLIQHMYYPSGGYIRYAWGWSNRGESAVYPDSNGNSTGCKYTYDTPVLLHRYVSFDGANEVLQQDFSYGTTWNGANWSSKTTAVTTAVKTVSNGTLQTIGSYTTTYTYGFVNAPLNYFQYSQFGRQIPVESSVVYRDYGGSTLETATKAWYNQYQLSDETVALADPNTLTKKTHYVWYCGGSPPGPTHAYLTMITYPPTANAQHVESFSYSYADGQLTVSTDQNQQSTQYAYADPLDRLTSITYPDGGQTTYGYWKFCGHPSSTTILRSGSNYTETVTFDGVCHVTRNAITPDPQGTDYTDTTYTGLGQVRTVSNPYRSTSEPTYGLTTTSYDALGRTISVAYADSSVATTSYSGNTSTVTDPAGKQRKLVSDALGRLTSVKEDPSGLNYSTSYTYDALNDLLTVNQGGQARTFSYDSLSHLLSATNPEVSLPNGTPCPISYGYDADGNMISRVAPLPNQSASCTSTVTTTYAYDALNRVTSKTYSDGTPTVTFSYDETSVALGSWTSPTLLYPIGRLTHTTTMTGSTLQSATVQDYDKMGRPKHYWQCTPLNCGTSSIWAALYNYDIAGDLTSWNHPAGFTIANTISAARRITQITSSLNDSTHPGTLAQNILYTAAGAVTGLQNGCVGSGCTLLQETYAYNNRLQMAMAELGTASNPSADSCRVYNYYAGPQNPAGCAMPSQSTNNNGDVAGYYYNDNANSGLSHKAAYSYDPVDRLVSAAATGNSTYSQTLTYDAYGNLSCAPSGPGCVALTYNAATNHITTSGYAYDAAGNLTGDGTRTYHWDAESHLTVTYVSGVAVQTNTYNALGQRVRDVTQTNTTDEAYGAGGELLWRYTGNSSDPNQRAFVPFGGGILAEYYGGSPGGTLFDHPDELGSLTASTSYNGAVCQERLFYPYGESWTGAGSCGMHQTFGKLPDYDAETDQYNTLNRHYSPSGRWLSPDPGGLKVVKLDDPQTWNMYAYVRNNPTTLTDPTGLTPPEKGVAAPVANTICDEHDPATCAPDPAISGDTKGGPGATQDQGWSLSWQVSASASFLVQELKGVYDVTLSPVVDAAEHPVQTARNAASDLVQGVKDVAKDPKGTLTGAAEGAKDQAVQFASQVASLNPRAIGQAAGLVINAYVATRAVQGKEIKLGNNLRIAPFGNRTGGIGELPHYHRRIVGPGGETLPGGGIGWHRPWEP